MQCLYEWVEYVWMMQELELGIPTQQSELDLPQSDDIRINDMGPVMCATSSDDEIELTQMNFGLPSDQPRRGPIFNYRSDGRNFTKSRRGLVVASGFLEFRGAKYPKNQASHSTPPRSWPSPASGAKLLEGVGREDPLVGGGQPARGNLGHVRNPYGADVA